MPGIFRAYEIDGFLSNDMTSIFVDEEIAGGATLHRYRFTLAHELGHWQLRHHTLAELPPDTLGYSGAFEDEGSHEGRSTVEVEANTFASELLMPSPWIRKLTKPLSIGAPSLLAQTYGVSEQAMFYQLMRCGRLT